MALLPRYLLALFYHSFRFYNKYILLTRYFIKIYHDRKTLHIEPHP